MRNLKFLLAAMRISKFLLAAAMRNSRVLLAATVLFFISASANVQLQRNDSERQLFEALNRERAAQGLSPLQWDDVLFKAARRHALRMANLNMLEHQLPNESNLEGRLAEAGARFSVIAENIAVGASPQIIHAGWMDSPGHRRNILDPRLTSVGIAAVHGPGGLFAVQDFSRSEEHTSELQSQSNLVCRLLLEKTKSYSIPERILPSYSITPQLRASRHSHSTTPPLPTEAVSSVPTPQQRCAWLRSVLHPLTRY